MIWFGPAGNSDSFYDQGFAHSWQMPQWLNNMGLNAYEYQCNKGVNLKAETAGEIGKKAKESSIRLSVHAPYYINLSSTEKQKRDNSVKYILDTLRIAKIMGAVRIVVHPGYVSGITRKTAVELALATMKEAVSQADEQGLSDITICPEVLGKNNQLGNLEEVMELCYLDKRFIPCIDFAHLHSLTQGGMNTEEDFEKVFRTVEKHLGKDRLKNVHIHFSRVEFGKGGEKKHWSYSDTRYGPDFDPLARVIIKLGLEPVVICESRGTMAEDALTLKNIYFNEAEKLA
ncbi:MAG: TIM barrel protein [Clostridiaceae bacterium]|jgi:deoxyribonuclease-4|nr:TIM barrel protein [Clostridiaceae bacterium]